MKAVLISIHPKFCELIFNGGKTIEVRKTAPKLETPFKVYVYCTKERMTRVPSMYAYLHKNEPRACAEYGTIETWGEIGDVIVNPHLASKHVSFGMHGKVIGSFVCDRIEKIEFRALCMPTLAERSEVNRVAKQACLTIDEMRGYLNGDNGYGWHITEPKLFDKPKELREFTLAKGLCAGRVSLIRPPQSWCYVEGGNHE